MKEEYIKWYSPNLSRDIEMLVFGHSGYRQTTRLAGLARNVSTLFIKN